MRAFDAPLPLAATTVVLLTGNAVGSAVPVPGGIGAVEAALTAGLVAFGPPLTAALAAVLLFRLLTLWARVPAGWLAFVVLQRRQEL